MLPTARDTLVSRACCLPCLSFFRHPERSCRNRRTRRPDRSAESTTLVYQGSELLIWRYSLPLTNMQRLLWRLIMATEPEFVRNIEDILQLARNDYSDEERLLQATPIQLVDAVVDEEISDPAIVLERRRTREALVRPLLVGDQRFPGASIIIPVRGGADALAECLRSITRQSVLKSLEPPEVEVTIVEDGIAEGCHSVFSVKAVREVIRGFADLGVISRQFRLDINLRRGHTRNAGLARSFLSIVIFVDASMILDQEFLVELLLRPERLNNRHIALLGFKENISQSEFEARRSAIVSGTERPDFRKDLKCSHTLKPDETESSGGFDFREKHYSTGDEINYMAATNFLKDLLLV